MAFQQKPSRWLFQWFTTFRESCVWRLHLLNIRCQVLVVVSKAETPWTHRCQETFSIGEKYIYMEQSSNFSIFSFTTRKTCIFMTKGLFSSQDSFVALSNFFSISVFSLKCWFNSVSYQLCYQSYIQRQNSALSYYFLVAHSTFLFVCLGLHNPFCHGIDPWVHVDVITYNN